MDKRALAIKLEQFRQAKRIHGGMLKLLTAALGIRLARLPIPTRPLRASMYRSIFSKKYPPGLNEREAELPLADYPSLNAVFTRGIKSEFRPMPADTPQFLAPCDGRVQDVGRIQHDRLVTLKGIEYTLPALLPTIDTQPFVDGHFAVIFLSPIDCHRVFSPQDALVEEAVHVPGFRLLVHPPYQRADFPVYTLNERLILRLTTPLGPCLVVLVAGWGVGNMTLPLDRSFRPRSHEVTRRRWSPPPRLQRGDWLATFELGSTVMLITPPGAQATALVAPQEEVKYGQPVLDYAG